MFELELSQKFQRIFQLKKVSFALPSDANEQDCLFVEIENSRNTIKDDRQIARVTGTARVFAQAEKLPFGFFSKKIREADPDDTKDLFFFDLEENQNYFRNLSVRSFSFIYFFDGQYDPDHGSITSIITFSEDDDA